MAKQNNLKCRAYLAPIIVMLGVAIVGCKAKKNDSTQTASVATTVEAPRFNADSAYSFVEKQVLFGPRVPNTRPHEKARAYFVDLLTRYGANVTLQEFRANTYAGESWALTNIVASYAPEKKKRILLAAHWDTRSMADKDPEDPTAPFDGANDGASGVGVLLEIARLLGATPTRVGVDILLLDGEDGGVPEGQSAPPLPDGWESWWCLGSQHWARHKHADSYSAYYGILLDMVGAKDSRFFKEGVSRRYAARIVNKIWKTADQIGYGSYFVKRSAGPIIDDHVYINKWAKIPTVNIVHYQPGVGYFGDYHHSRKDNMNLISKETLEAVGQTVVQVIYQEPE